MLGRLLKTYKQSIFQSILEKSLNKKKKVEMATIQIAAAPAPIKAKVPKVKKPGSKPTHPPTATLVNAAIRALKERNGSSLQAIKKFIAINNKLDTDKLSPFIKKYLKKATASGKLVQTKGKGASGSFKLSAASLKPKVEKKKKKSAVKKAGSKKPKAKKTDTPKKKVAPKQKSLKPSKAKAPKPKTPKVKKAQAKKPVTAAKKAHKPAAK